MKNGNNGQHRRCSYDLLTGRRISIQLGCFLKETCCRDETDLITQTRGPDFVTESWDPGQFGPGPIGTRDPGPRDPGPDPSLQASKPNMLSDVNPIETTKDHLSQRKAM